MVARGVNQPPRLFYFSFLRRSLADVQSPSLMSAAPKSGPIGHSGGHGGYFSGKSLLGTQLRS